MISYPKKFLPLHCYCQCYCCSFNLPVFLLPMIYATSHSGISSYVSHSSTYLASLFQTLHLLPDQMYTTLIPYLCPPTSILLSFISYFTSINCYATKMLNDSVPNISYYALLSAQMYTTHLSYALIIHASTSTTTEFFYPHYTNTPILATNDTQQIDELAQAPVDIFEQKVSEIFAIGISKVTTLSRDRAQSTFINKNSLRLYILLSNRLLILPITYFINSLTTQIDPIFTAFLFILFPPFICLNIFLSLVLFNLFRINFDRFPFFIEQSNSTVSRHPFCQKFNAQHIRTTLVSEDDVKVRFFFEYLMPYAENKHLFFINIIVQMIGNRSYLQVKDVEKSIISGQISESKFQEILEDKDKEIQRLTKTIKKLKKDLKSKEQVGKVPVKYDGNTAYFKVLIEKQVNRYNELRDVLVGVTERIKKLCQEINSQFSIFQSSASMQNIVNMLQNANISGTGGGKSMSLEQSQSREQESIQAEQAVDQFEVVVRGLMMKHGQMNKTLKQNSKSYKQLKEQYSSLEKELKAERKSKDLLQTLLQKSETQKNQLMNQINSIVSKQEIEDIKSKNKQELIISYLKLHYRIRDLEKEKEEYLKSSTKDKQKQVKLYEVLLNQVKNMKDKQRSRQSVA